MSSPSSHVILTGGAGYIGSHTIIELQNAGYSVVVVDSLANSSLEPLNRVRQITGKSVEFHKVDIRDVAGLNAVFAKYDKISCVIHFAALKSIGESWEKPALYYATNVVGTLNVIEAMAAHKDCNNLIISSSGMSTPTSNPQ
jgi:UDP-glucose 4-epimerase